ncbi:MAG TPA: DUF2231 domain-containing protein [Gemmatimonadales bacterium]|nr:DUF2231 domain-containing protein [Gemmatimonadales bacterium]
MPDLGPLHPQIVHFVVALLLVGVALRWIALTGKVPFAGPAATTLLLLGTVAAVLAVSSGTAAHDVVERIPGVGQAVRDHEDWGETTRTVFLIVAGLEIVALVLARRRAAWGRWAFVLSGLVGLYGCYAVYETADRGGKLVYTFAGGPGLRTGDTSDIGRLFTAGLYEQAMVDRARHQSADAAALIDELARRSPNDTAVQLIHIESQLRDRQDAKGALAALGALHPAADNPRLVVRVGTLTADTYIALGQTDSAKAVLRRLVAQFPMFQRLKDRLTQLGG